MMTNETQLQETLLNALIEVAPEIEKSEVDLDENLQEQLELDSVDMINYLSTIGEKLGVEIPSQEINSFATIKTGVKYLVEHPK